MIPAVSAGSWPAVLGFLGLGIVLIAFRGRIAHAFAASMDLGRGRPRWAGGFAAVSVTVMGLLITLTALVALVIKISE